MRIDRLKIQNFKPFDEFELELDPRFNLLVGENGTGKTSILEALTVALGIWLVKPPDPELNNSRRNIYRHEIRLVAKKTGDRVQFAPRRPVRIEAEGHVQEVSHRWVRQIGDHGERTSNQEASKTLAWIQKNFQLDSEQTVIFPILAYYGAGRAWLPSNERPGNRSSKARARRWSAFYDCFSERVHFSQLVDWFRREAMAAVGLGRYRPGFEVVRQAVMRCIPGATDLWFDPDRQELVLSLEGQAQPMGNLSAGQRMMLALVADLAIKAVTQNNCLVDECLKATWVQRLGYTSDEGLPKVLARTPGVVLIDELDVHLHPRWQRRVVNDLRTTFPSIQFVTTTHSPFVIQALGQGRLIRLDQPEISLWPESESLEDIAEAVQGVPSPQRSLRAKKLDEATARYYSLLKRRLTVSAQELAEAEREFREASEGFTTQPGLEAVLKLEALAAEQRSD